MFKDKEIGYGKSILVSLGLILTVFFALSWVIPTGLSVGTTFQSSEMTNPIGFFDFFRVPASTLVNSSHIIFYILLIGGLYGILGQTGSYNKLVDKTAKCLKKRIVANTTLIFSIATTLTGNLYLIFVFVPFFIAVLFKNKVDKLTAFAATVGAILVGNVVGILSSNMLVTIKSYYAVETTTMFIEKLIIVAVFITLYTMWVNKRKGEEKHEKIPLLFEEKKSSKQDSYIMFNVLTGMIVVFLFLVMFNWSTLFEIEFFKNISTNIMDNKILSKITGGFNNFGNWGLYDLTIMIMAYIAMLIFIFGIKLEVAFESFKEGTKQVLKPALLGAATFVVYHLIMVTDNSTGYNIYNTVTNFVFEITGEFAILGTFINSIFSSLVYSDFGFFVHYLSNVADFTSAASIPLLTLVMQMTHGLMMLLVPTSLFLVAGLSLVEVSYFKWMKYIFKISLLFLLLGTIFVGMIAYMV